MVLSAEEKKERNREYYEKNKEKIKEQRAEYYEKNKEKIAEYNKEYKKKYRENKEKIKEQRAEQLKINKERNRKYYEKNKEKRAEYAKKYYQTANGKKSNKKSQWKRNGLIATEEEVERIYDLYLNQELCNTCNIKLTRTGKCVTTDATLDYCHKTNKFSQICCWDCNMRYKWIQSNFQPTWLKLK